GRGFISRGDRGLAPNGVASVARPGSPALRRVAAPPAPPGRRTFPTPHGVRTVHVDRHGGIRRASAPRAGGQRRDATQAHSREPRRSDRTGTAGRAACPRWYGEYRERGSTLPEPAHRGLPPAQGVLQAGDPLATRAGVRA